MKAVQPDKPSSLLERLLMAVVPYVDIVKTVDGEKVVYLRRFKLWRSKSGNIYLHHIFRSDDDPDPHDHPWDFTSLILSKGYRDEQWLFVPMVQSEPGKAKGPIVDSYPNPVDITVKGQRFKIDDEICRPPNVVQRNAEHIHRVILDRGPAWTLVFTGPIRRSWGFIRATQWSFWREYLNVWGKRGDTD